MKFGRNPIKNDYVRVTTTESGQTDRQAENNIAPPAHQLVPNNSNTYSGSKGNMDLSVKEDIISIKCKIYKLPI